VSVQAAAAPQHGRWEAKCMQMLMASSTVHCIPTPGLPLLAGKASSHGANKVLGCVTTVVVEL